MVALVVVLQDHFPVRGDLVDKPVPDAQLCERVGGESVICPVELVLQGPAVGVSARRTEPGEDETAPGGDGDRVQR